jgi:hypothetical protein
LVQLSADGIQGFLRIKYQLANPDTLNPDPGFLLHHLVGYDPCTLFTTNETIIIFKSKIDAYF